MHPSNQSLVREGVELLHALAVANLTSYFHRLTDAQQFLDSLHAGRADAEVRTLFLNEIASPAVQQLAAAGATDAAASLLESISSLRITKFGPRIAKDPEAKPLLSDLHATLIAFATT